MELSPEDIRKDKGKILPVDFKIYIKFEDFCAKCNPHTTEIDDICSMCRNELGETTIAQWKEVKTIMDKHSYPNLE